MRKVSSRLNQGGRWLQRAAHLLPALGLAALLAACEVTGELTPDETDQVQSGTVYVDTLTVRMSTVLVDSVPTSTSDYLLVGQVQDARLGTVTARSYLRLGLSGAFRPDADAQLDSLVLHLPPDTYRYGDTTQLQHLQVHRLTEALRPGTTYYAFNSRAYEAAPLGTRAFRARGKLATIRVRLTDALGQELLRAGSGRQLTSNDELNARLPGLALTPGTADNAALLRLLATSTSLQLQLYYHSPATPDVSTLYAFTAAAVNQHFYQLHADRRGSLLTALTTTRQSLPSARTAAETYLQGGLGLQTKVEIPYLLRLNELGGTWVINSAQLLVETVAGTESRNLAAPGQLTVQLTDRGNHSGRFLTNSSGTVLTVSYQTGVSRSTNLEQGRYVFSVQAYCEAALNHTLANNGLLLAPATPDTPERAVLGAPGNTNPPRLAVYLTKVK
ncbi:DUF4270 family protein [Hymenobacter metallilatus]|nr:DUF4270 family protein [Hymenobacter metallilatus]